MPGILLLADPLRLDFVTVACARNGCRSLLFGAGLRRHLGMPTS